MGRVKKHEDQPIQRCAGCGARYFVEYPEQALCRGCDLLAMAQRDELIELSKEPPKRKKRGETHKETADETL